MSATAEYLDQFTTDEAGTIVTEGKFEGHDLSIPYLWDIALNGDCIERFDGENCYYFLMLAPSDLEEFPQLKDHYGTCMYEDNDGVQVIWYDSRVDFEEAQITGEL